MGIQGFDQAPDAETLLMNENVPAATNDDDVEEEAEAALTTVDAEFGRTTCALNSQGGRDHFLRTSHVFAGGGVPGGRALGTTDSLGAAVVEYGWRVNRYVRPEDVTCKIYSALGIDYTTTRHDDPLNRGFEYVPYAKDGLYQPIDDLFV